MNVLVGVGVVGIGTIWMASTLAWSTLAGPKVRVMAPPEGLMLLKTSSTALKAPPAAETISKWVKTWVPLMATLKTRCPAADQ